MFERRNPPLICAYHALHMTLLPMAIITIFWQHQIGMSMLQIMAVQGIFGCIVALFEFPSGYLADRLGYRRTLLLASLLLTAAWSLYIHAATLPRIILAEVPLGIGVALISGTDDALLFESLRVMGQDTTYLRWTGRMRFFGQSAEALGALGAGWLFATAPHLPFLLQTLIAATTFGVALALREPARDHGSPPSHLAHLRHLARFTFQGEPALRWLLAALVLFGLASFVPVWTIQLYAIDCGVPETWLGPIWASANFIVAIGALLSHRFERRLGLLPTLFLGILLIAIGFFGMAAAHALWGFLFYFALTLMRGLLSPILLDRFQRLIPSSDRATLLSLQSLLFRLSFLALGPLAGWGIDHRGQRPILALLGLLLVALTATAASKLRRHLPHH
jgi:MFS family permease